MLIYASAWNGFGGFGIWTKLTPRLLGGDSDVDET